VLRWQYVICRVFNECATGKYGAATCSESEEARGMKQRAVARAGKAPGGGESETGRQEPGASGRQATASA